MGVKTPNGNDLRYNPDGMPLVPNGSRMPASLFVSAKLVQATAAVSSTATVINDEAAHDAAAVAAAVAAAGANDDVQNITAVQQQQQYAVATIVAATTETGTADGDPTRVCGMVGRLRLVCVCLHYWIQLSVPIFFSLLLFLRRPTYAFCCCDLLLLLFIITPSHKARVRYVMDENATNPVSALYSVE